MDSIKLLVLWLTNDCNLRCRYCYANAGEKKEYMSFETAKMAIDRIKSGPFKVQLAGGEPLLNLELVRLIYKYIKEAGTPAVLQMQTNGTLIRKETASELKKMNISLGVSMDGGVEMNEALRGKSADIIQGIQHLAQAGIKVNLNCVVTSLNVKHLPQLVDMAFYFGNVGGIGLDLLRKSGRAIQKQIAEADPDEISAALRAAYEKTQFLYSITGKKIIIREIEDARKRLLADTKCKGYCHASCGGSMVVLPDGCLYPCGSLAGMSQYYMGNVNQENIKIIELKTNKDKNCTNCKYKKVCPGGCPSRLIMNYGNTYYSPQDCALRRTAFEIAEYDIKNQPNKPCDTREEENCLSLKT